MIPVALDATNHDILQACSHEKWHKIGETGKLSVSYQHMRRVCIKPRRVIRPTLESIIRRYSDGVFLVITRINSQ